MNDFHSIDRTRRQGPPLPNHRGHHHGNRTPGRVNRAQPEIKPVLSGPVPKDTIAKNTFIAQESFKNRIPANLWREALLAENPEKVLGKKLYDDIMLDRELKGDFHEKRVRAIIRDTNKKDCLKNKLKEEFLNLKFTIDDRVGGRYDFDHAKVDTIMVIAIDEMPGSMAFHQVPEDIDVVGVPIQVKSRELGKEEHELKSKVPCIAVEGKSRTRIENELVEIALDFQPPLSKDELGKSIREIVEIVKAKYMKIKSY